VRALLVVNPNATATTARGRDVVVHALSADHDVEVVETNHRGHAIALGARARAEGRELVITFGGDGTVNEVVNGMLAEAGPGDDVPLLATVPGGSANVFARALGLPADTIEATGELLDAIRHKRVRTIGLGHADHRSVGHADQRWFCFNAGVGLDAEIIEAMESRRAQGHRATTSRYVSTALRHYFRSTDRRTPALTLTRPGQPPIEGIFVALVQNTSPWTFMGPFSLDPSPHASFDTGLDLFAVRRLGVFSTLRYSRRMVLPSRGPSNSDGLVTLHDAAALTLLATRPMPLQLDGDSCGRVREVTFRSVPRALRVLV